MVHYRHYLFGLFIGFQEGYIFGSILKVNEIFSNDLLISIWFLVWYNLSFCSWDIHIEMLISYGLGATMSSILLALMIRRITFMVGEIFRIESFFSSKIFFRLLYRLQLFFIQLTIILLYLIRTQNRVCLILQPLTIEDICCFFSYGVVLGLWSTIAIRKCATFVQD